MRGSDAILFALEVRKPRFALLSYPELFVSHVMCKQLTEVANCQVLRRQEFVMVWTRLSSTVRLWR